MSLYRNLGSITFVAETKGFEIFKTSKQDYIFQIKADIVYDKSAHAIKIFESQFPTFKIHFYQQILKPKAFILEHCFKLDIGSPSIQQLQQILKVIIKVMRMWPSEKIGELNQNLLYKSQEGKLIFFSVPIFNIEKLQNTSKDVYLAKFLIEFIGNLLQQPNAWQTLFLKKIKECKQLNSILVQLQYFIKLSKITINESFTSSNSQIKIPHYSTHSHAGKQSINKIKRKYHLFRQSEKQNSMKQSLNNAWEEPQIQVRKGSRAIHVSNVSLHATLKRYKSKQKSQSAKSHSLRSNISKKNTQNFFLQTNPNMNEKLKVLTSQKFNKRSQRSIKLTQTKQNSQHRISSTRQSKQHSIISQREKWMKELVHKSLQKWKSKKFQKQKVNKFSKNGNTKQITKKKLKKTHCVPNAQVDQIIQNINMNQMKTLKNSPSTSYEKYPNPASAIKQQHIQKKQEEGVKQIKQTNKISRQMITKIPLKEHHQQKEDRSSSTMRKTTMKSQFHAESKKQIYNSISQIELKLKNYDCIGQAVANTSIHLQKFQKILWQIPMFFFYKQYYILRVQIQQKGVKRIHEQNLQIEQSLKKLITVSRKKISKSQMSCDNVKKYINMDLVADFKHILSAVFKQYYQALVPQLQQYNQLSKHIIEISQAYLVIEGQFLDFAKKEKAEKDAKYQKIYLLEKIKEVEKKLKNI